MLMASERLGLTVAVCVWGICVGFALLRSDDSVFELRQHVKADCTVLSALWKRTRHCPGVVVGVERRLL